MGRPVLQCRFIVTDEFVAANSGRTNPASAPVSMKQGTVLSAYLNSHPLHDLTFFNVGSNEFQVNRKIFVSSTRVRLLPAPYLAALLVFWVVATCALLSWPLLFFPAKSNVTGINMLSCFAVVMWASSMIRRRMDFRREQEKQRSAEAIQLLNEQVCERDRHLYAFRETVRTAATDYTPYSEVSYYQCERCGKIRTQGHGQ
jgi:hypothetical protein